MVETVNGKSVIPNRRLRDYLEQEVPKMARAVFDHVNQLPDAEVCSDDYIGHVSTTERLAVSGTLAPTLSDVASTAIGTELGGGRLQGPPNTLRTLPAASGFLASADTIVTARGLSNKLAARSGFVVSGVRLASVTARPGIKTDFTNSSESSRPSALVEVDTPHAASVALRFPMDQEPYSPRWTSS